MGQIVKTNEAARTTWAQAQALADAKASAQVARANFENKKRIANTTYMYEDWTNFTANGWVVSSGATVGGNRMWGGNGVRKTINLAPKERMVLRWSYKTLSTGLAFGGVSNPPDPSVAPGASDNDGLFVGQNGTLVSFVRGSNLVVSDAPATNATVSGTLEFFCTIVIDETHVSLFVGLESGTGGLTYRTKRSNFSNQSDGTIKSIALVANGTGASQTGTSIGPVIMVRGDIVAPPTKTIGGKNLFPNTSQGHINFNRQDETTNIRHMIRIPVNYDPNVGAPIAQYCHQATSGDISDIYADTRTGPMADILLANGYIVMSSDNGTNEGESPNNDRFGSQAGLNDYKACIDFVRDNFVTQKLFVWGASQGSYVTFNIIGRPEVGQIAAAYVITGGAFMRYLTFPTAFDSYLFAEYGVSNSTDLINTMLAQDLEPGSHAPYAYRRTPVKIVVSPGDTTAPPSVVIGPWLTKMTGWLTEIDYVEKTGDHYDPSMFVPADILAFFEKYRY
jgi:hypothetical protein